MRDGAPQRRVQPRQGLPAEAKMLKAAQDLLLAARIQSPPVDLECLAQMQGVKQILLEPLDGPDAKLTPIEGGYEIRVDPRGHPRMRRFSIAHEIAHTFFRHNHESFRHQAVRLANGITGGTYRLEESLCDQAAAELLMPKQMFLAEAGRRHPSVALIERLAEIFESSIKATAIRYASLLATPGCQMTIWRKRDSELRASWVRGTMVLDELGRVASLENPEAGLESSIVQAFTTQGRVKDWQPDGYRRVLVDAKAFGTQKDRYVLSIMTSATTF